MHARHQTDCRPREATKSVTRAKAGAWTGNSAGSRIVPSVTDATHDEPSSPFLDVTAKVALEDRISFRTNLQAGTAFVTSEMG